MERKIKVVFSIGLLTLVYIFLIGYFYFDYSNSLDEFNSNSYESLDSLQNIIHKIHNEDSLLYKTLLSKDTSNNDEGSCYISNSNQTCNVINELLKLRDKQTFSSIKLASTISEYYSLEKTRERIIDLHRLNLLDTGVNYDDEISSLLKEYENQINLILIEINQEIENNNKNNILAKDMLLFKFLLMEFFSFIFFVIAIVIIVFLSDTHKMFKRQKNSIEDKQEENIILDSNSRKIINYIRNEMAQGNFPTIKELKFYLKISHPTLLLKLNDDSASTQ